MCPIFLYDVYCEPFLDPHLSKHGVLKGNSSIASYHTTKDGPIQQISAQLHTPFMHLSVYSVKHCAILRHLVHFQRSLYHLCHPEVESFTPSPRGCSRLTLGPVINPSSDSETSST